MIRSFACDDTDRLFRLEKVRAFPPDIQRTALRKLAQLHAVTELIQLRAPLGNRLETLKGKRKGQHSIRINDQWPICFRWDQTARMMSKSYLVISMTFLGSNIFKGIITKTVKAKSSIEGGRNRNDGELLAPRPC
jgi:proteic killer suppression protein